MTVNQRSPDRNFGIIELLVMAMNWFRHDSGAAAVIERVARVRSPVLTRGGLTRQSAA